MTKGIDGVPLAPPDGVGDEETRSEIRFARWATGAAFLIVLFLIAFAWHAQRGQIIARETERAENLARAFEFHVHHEIQNIDDLLRQLRKMQLDSEQGFHDAVSELRAGELGQRAVHFSLIGADGMVRHSTQEDLNATRPYVGDQSVFKAHSEPGTDRLYVGRPRVTSLTAQASLRFSRRYVAPSGQFMGVVVLAMPTSFLTDGALSLGLREGDVATILRQDGYILSRTQPTPGLAQQVERLPEGFMARFQDQEHGVFEEASPVDQVRRLIAFRKSSEFPVTAIVGPATEHRDGELAESRWRHLLLLVLFGLLLLIAHNYNARALRRVGLLRQERERERRHLTEAQAIAHIGGWRIHPETRTAECSEEVFRILDLHANDRSISVETLFSRVHSEDRPALEAAFGKAYETSLRFEHRHRIVRPDGAIRHVIQHIQSLADARGRVVQLAGTIQDVTEAMAAEMRQLEAAVSNRLARAVFDGVMQPMVVFSPEGRLIDVNPAFEEVFALSGEGIRGRNLIDLESSPEGQLAFACNPSRLFQHDKPTKDWEGDVTVQKEGGERVLSLSISGVCDASRRIEHYIGIYTDVTDRKRRERAAVHLSHHDALTGLPNRQYLVERLTRSLHRAQRRFLRGVVIYIDLDGFKGINDTYGHEAGDLVLKGVTQRFQAVIRQEDLVARLGGDEFVALIEEVGDMDVVNRLAESLRQAASDLVTEYNGHLLQVSASLGVAVFPHGDEDVSALMARADRAMYDAKGAGRNAISFSTVDRCPEGAAAEM